MTKLLTPEEVAEILRISQETVIAMCEIGDIEAIKVHNYWRIKKESLEQLIDDSYISIEDAADLAGVSITHLSRLIRNKQIRSRITKNGKQVSWNDTKVFIRQQIHSKIPFWSLITNEELQSLSVPKQLLNNYYLQDKRLSIEEFEVNRVIQGNCLTWLHKMPLQSVQTVVTSPPYWGVRSYVGDQIIKWSDGTECAFGAEATVEEYVRHSAEILYALKPVLKDNGTIWWNLGDTYQTRAYMRSSSQERLDAIEGRVEHTWKDYENKRYSSGHSYLKDKDLTLVPFQVAMAAQHLGYYVRSIIIWSKDNVGLDSAKDRPTPSHEYIFLFAKSRFYKYHLEYSQEKAISGSIVRNGNGTVQTQMSEMRKIRSIWSFAASNSHGNHVAAFPLELPWRCIQISTDPEDLVFDPFMGSGTTGLAAKLLGRKYFGCDIAHEYVDEANLRIATGSISSKVTKRKKASKKDMPLYSSEKNSVAKEIDGVESQTEEALQQSVSIQPTLIFEEVNCPTFD